jgi:hypothetical protein
MDASKPLSLGLESLALALIFAPEPFSTFVGIGLLAATRAAKMKRVSNSNNIAKPAHGFDDYYQYRIGMVKRDSLGYNIKPLREGQLTGSFPQAVRLYDTQAWGSYRHGAYSYLNNKKPPQFSGIQKGLLQDMNRGLNRRKY